MTCSIGLKLYYRTLVNPIDVKNGLGTLCLCKLTEQKCNGCHPYYLFIGVTYVVVML